MNLRWHNHFIGGYGGVYSTNYLWYVINDRCYLYIVPLLYLLLYTIKWYFVQGATIATRSQGYVPLRYGSTTWPKTPSPGTSWSYTVVCVRSVVAPYALRVSRGTGRRARCCWSVCSAEVQRWPLQVKCSLHVPTHIFSCAWYLKLAACCISSRLHHVI